MTTNEENNNVRELKQSPEVKNSELIKEGFYYPDRNRVKISLNGKINADIVFTPIIDDWPRNIKIVWDQAQVYGYTDKTQRSIFYRFLNDNEDILTSPNNTSNNKSKEQTQEEDEEKPKQLISTFKYSEMGRGELHESVFIAGFATYIRFNNNTGTFEGIDKIEEATRILVPPAIEECPHLPYEFDSLDEINGIARFIEDNDIDRDYLYKTCYKIVSRYNNQLPHKLKLIAINIITSHFQDRFSTTHYLYLVGGNGSGKTSIAETLRGLAYRAAVMTDPSAPNLFRSLGMVESMQCTMVLEEADKIDKSPELMAVLKTGFSYGGWTPKINQYTSKSERHFTYCPKIIISERSLNQSIAKGVNSRIFSINCFKGSIKHDILEVLNPTNTGGPDNKRLLQEIMNFRKLLLVYRLMHFKEMIPDLDIGVEGRDRQLVKYCVQLFHGCKCQNEVVETLQTFLDIKNNKKQSSIESVLLPIIDKLTENTNQVSSLDFWKAIINEIPGLPDLHKPNEFHTDDYGTLYRTTISGMVCDCFGASIKHGDKGNILVFDRTVIKELVKSDIENDKTRIIVKEITTTTTQSYSIIIRRIRR